MVWIYRALAKALILMMIPLAVIGASEEPLFIRAKRALFNGDEELFFQLRDQMNGHPLAPYLDYYYIRAHFKTVDEKIIEQYIATYPESPMAYNLRVMLQNKLIEQKKWSDFLLHYKPSTHVDQQCNYLMALHETGKKAEAYAAVEPLWRQTQTPPGNCEPLFKLWLSSITNRDELMWERFELALIDKKPEYAATLLHAFSKAKKHEAEQVLRVYGNPRLINNDSFLKAKPTAEVISFAIARLARISPVEAINAWKKWRPISQFNEDQEQRIFQAVGMTMAYRGEKNATQWFRKVIGMDLPPVYKEWMMRSGILQGDWQFVVDSIRSLPKEEQQELQWQYWYGRALGELGRTNESRKVLENIADERDYYGFLADYYLKQPIVVHHHELTISREELNQVLRKSGYVRAKLLYALDLQSDARAELFMLMNYISEKEQYIVSKLVSDWGWYPLSLRLSHLADHKDDITVRFPMPFKDIIARYAKEQKVDPALIYAIMRQESYFTTYAKSPAGAIGLMQLMPETAARTAKKFTVSYGSAEDLLDEKKNIQLGSAHINELNKILKSHPVLIIAAYNAGATAVNRWLPRDKTLPPDIWIESVRYKETRKYLRHVIAGYVVYQERLGMVPSLDNVMRPIRK